MCGHFLDYCWFGFGLGGVEAMDWCSLVMLFVMRWNKACISKSTPLDWVLFNSNGFKIYVNKITSRIGPSMEIWQENEIYRVWDWCFYARVCMHKRFRIDYAFKF